MFIVPRQLLLTQWFFFVHPYEISSCACIAQFSKDIGCPRNYTCHSLLKVIFEFLIGCLLCLDSYFGQDVESALRQKTQAVIHRSWVTCFPSLRDCSSVLFVVQHQELWFHIFCPVFYLVMAGGLVPNQLLHHGQKELLEMQDSA